MAIAVDVLIVGGGVSGLWTLDVLRRAGLSCVLLESAALGTGQTVGSQGIVHGGLKYTLAGALTRSAEAIREMPAVWRAALAGQAYGGVAQPDLRSTRMRSDFCWLWRTGRWSSRLGMVGARVGLSVKPRRVSPEDWPGVLAGVGDVFRLDEPVVRPGSLVSALAGLHPECLVKCDDGVFHVEHEGDRVVRWCCTSGGRRLDFAPRWVVLTAGLGNAELRERMGVREVRMQRRGVQMVLVREVEPGSDALPELNGHCVDGQQTRVTITSDVDAQGRRVWQVGGRVSEVGIDWPAEELVRYARREVEASLGGRRLAGVEWSTYRLDKAEVTTAGGRRPDDAFVERSAGGRGNVLTCWPTKLALAPRLAERVLEHVRDVESPVGAPELGEVLRGCERPAMADAPWDEPREWVVLDEVDAGALA